MDNKPLISDFVRGYRFPEPQHIGSDEKNLYRYEEQALKSLRKAADEMGRITELGRENSKQFFTHTLPQFLFDLLDNWDQRAAYVAAKAFCTKIEKEHENA